MMEISQEELNLKAIMRKVSLEFYLKQGQRKETAIENAEQTLKSWYKIIYNLALLEVLEKMPEEKQLGDGMYIDTDKKAFYDDGISEGFNQCLKEVIKIVEGLKK